MSNRLGSFTENLPFGLDTIIMGRQVYLRLPRPAEVDFIRQLWSDPPTMEPVGGTVAMTEKQWRSWYKRMIDPGGFENRYFLIFNKSDEPVGEISFHGMDSETGRSELNVKVLHRFRNKGYATFALPLLLQYFFEYCDGILLADAVAINNDIGQRAIAAAGFEVECQTESAVLMNMTKHRYQEICQAKFGISPGTLPQFYKVGFSSE